MNIIAKKKKLKFYFSTIFGIYNVISGLRFVGDGLRLIFECVYIVNSCKSHLIYLVRMLCSVHGTSEDSWALYCA